MLERFKMAISTALIREIGTVVTINSQSIRVKARDENGDVIRCTGTVVVTGGGAGYAKACDYIKTDAINGVDGYFENIGTNLACNFVQVNAVLPGEIALANSHILVGNALGAAADVAMSGDATLDNTGALTIAAQAVNNAKISNTAAIAFTKLASLTSGHILVGSVLAVATDVAMSGDATLASTGAITIANGAVTPVKQSTAARQRSIQCFFPALPAPTGANQLGNTRYMVTMPQAGTITAAKMISNLATVGSGASNQYTMLLKNATQAVNVGSASSGTNGAEFASETAKSLLVDLNPNFNLGDVITLNIDILDDAGAGPTNLQGAQLRVQIDYTI